MNRIAVNIVISTLVICFAGCDTMPVAEQSIDNTQATVIEVDVNNDFLNLDSVVCDYGFTRLETSDECLIGEVSKLSFRNDKYYILDRHRRKALFVFDKDGKFRNCIGRRGRGPGEFIEPTDFIVSDSTVMVFDMFGHKFLCYDLDGTFVKSVPLIYTVYEIEPGRDGAVIYAVSGDNAKTDSLKGYELFGIDREGRILSKIHKNRYTMNFSNEYDLQCFNGDVIYKKALRPAVYRPGDDKLYAKYIFDISSHALPADYEKVCRGDFGRFIKKFRDEYTYFNGQFWETDRYAGIGITGKRMPYLVIYDKQTQQTVSGLVGITFGGEGPDTNGLFTSVMNGPVDVAGDRIIGVVDDVRLSPDMENALFGKAAGNFSNPVVVTLDLKPRSMR